MSYEPKNKTADSIRAAFRKSGLSIRQVSLRAGTPYSCTHGVLTGDRDPTLSTAAKLAKGLGYELVLVPKRKGKR